MNAEGPMIIVSNSHQDASLAEGGKRGRKLNWRGWQKRGRGGYRGRGHANVLDKANSTMHGMNNLPNNESYSESHPGGSWASQEDIKAMEEVVVTNTLGDKENSYHGRQWNQRRQGGWKKYESNERNEEYQNVSSQEIKLSGRGGNGYKHRGIGRGKVQQSDCYVESEEKIVFDSAKDMKKSNCGLNRDIKISSLGETGGETGETGVFLRGRGRGRGYFRGRGRGRKKQYLNYVEKKQEENDASSTCTDLSTREGGRASKNSLERKDEIGDAQEHNNSSIRQCPGQDVYRNRGQVHQRGSCIQKNKCANRAEEIILSDEGPCRDDNPGIHGNSSEIASTETDSTYREAPVNAGRGRGNKAARSRGYFGGRGRKKQNFCNAGTNQGENSVQGSDHFSGKRGERVRSNKDLFMKQADSIERNVSNDVTEPNDATFNNGFTAFEKIVSNGTNNADIFLEDVSIASEENKFPKPRTRNRRGQWGNQYASESIRHRSNMVSKILEGCAEELINENVNVSSNFPSEDGRNSIENKEHFLEKTNDSASFGNNDVPKHRRRNRRRKWKNHHDKQNITENIFDDDGGLEKNTTNEPNCLNDVKGKETKTKNQQPDIILGDNKSTYDRKCFENWFSANWVEIAKGGMPTYPEQFVTRNNQEPKQDLDTKKYSNKILLQELFSKAPTLINKGNVPANVPDTSNLAVLTAVDTAPPQAMSLANKTVNVTTPRNSNSIASTSVATTSPVSITTIAGDTVEAIKYDNISIKDFTSNSDIQTHTTISSSTKSNPGSPSTSITPTKSILSTTLASNTIPVTKPQTSTAYKTAQHPTSTSTTSAKKNSSVTMVTGSTNSMNISPPSPQTLPKTAIASNLTASSSSPFTNAQSPDISATATSQTYVKQPGINKSSSIHQVSFTGFSNHTNLQPLKTYLPSAVRMNHLSTTQQNTMDSFTHGFASSTATKRITVPNYAVSHMTVKRNTGNSNKLKYQLTDKCKLVIKSYGDIVKEKSELLVCVLGPDADMRKTKLGQSFNKEFPNHWQELLNSRIVNPYSPVLTIHNPLGFKGQAICHILLTPWNRAKSQDQINIALHELFDVVDDLNIQSISIPPLGCGLAFKFPPKYMVHWLLKHIKNMTFGRYLKKIVLLAPSSELFDEFKTQASKYFVNANTYIEEDMREDPIQIDDIGFNLKPKRGTLEYIHYLIQQETEFPSYWNLGKTNTKSNSTWWGFVTSIFTGANKPYLVDVSDETKAAISRLVIGSQDPHVIGHGADAVGMNYSSIKVIDVQRIEQPNLFKKYHKKRREILEKRIRKGFACQDVGKITGSKGKVLTKTLLSESMKDELCSEINEHYLFHGTKAKALENIIVNGFDPSCSKALSLFGQGVYTAEKSTKADQYTDEKSCRSPNGTKLSLILTRVLLGDVFVCDENHPCLESKVCRKLTKPPCMRCQEDLCFCGSEEHYDSVMGDGKWLFREFVVYEGSQCYPEYLITYQRV